MRFYLLVCSFFSESIILVAWELKFWRNYSQILKWILTRVGVLFQLEFEKLSWNFSVFLKQTYAFLKTHSWQIAE